jgi:hypothetical protein
LLHRGEVPVDEVVQQAVQQEPVPGQVRALVRADGDVLDGEPAQDFLAVGPFWVQRGLER